MNENGEGALVVLRGATGNENQKINIPWVNAEASYHLKALFSGKELGSYSGKQLQEGEILLALDRMGQEIVEVSIIKKSE